MVETTSTPCCQYWRNLFVEAWDLLKIMYTNKYRDRGEMQNVWKGFYWRAHFGLLLIIL